MAQRLTVRWWFLGVTASLVAGCAAAERQPREPTPTPEPTSTRASPRRPSLPPPDPRVRTLAAADAAKLPDLAFVRGGDLFLFTGADRGEVALTTTHDCSHPSWTTDGRALIYTRGAVPPPDGGDRRGDLWRLEPDKRNATQLTTSGQCFQPAVCPASGEVWFVRRENKGQIIASLWSMGANGEEPRWRANLRGDFALIGPGTSKWRPDGKVLALQVDDQPDGCSVKYFDSRGRTAAAPVPDEGPGRLKNARAYVSFYGVPAWQKGGRLLVRDIGDYRPGAEPERARSFDVWDTVAKRIVRSIEPQGSSPDISADGKLLAFQVSNGDENAPVTSIQWLKLPDDKPEKLLDNAAEPTWRPSP